MAYQEKLELYEAVIEEVTAENTRLMLQLDSVETLERDKRELLGHVDMLRKENRGLKQDASDLKHKLNV